MSIDFIAWPDVLPLPQRAGHSVTPADTVIRFETESGYERRRRVPSIGPATVPVDWIMTARQYDTFKGWYRHVIADGVREFRIFIDDGESSAVRNAWFTKSPPKAVRIKSKNLWRITATLAVRDLPVIDENETLNRIYSMTDTAQQAVDAADGAVTDYVTE